ncbi:MAG TPA: SRPBCC domain-containing protein [Ramlibacter sp.]|nr:SRPBCC domain-containing protein [Ramlibacter sp.]
MDSRRIEEAPELRITRSYPVAPEKVWRAWTDPQALSAWFGPGEPNSVLVAEMDVRGGGRYRIRFRTPDGEEHEVAGEYRDVVPDELLSFTWAWHTTPERVSLVTVRLRPADGGTELDFRHARFFDGQARESHAHGWSLTFEKLDAWVRRPSINP